MSLRTLGRVSCKLFGHGACECSPSALSAVQFCRPISTIQSSGKKETQRKGVASNKIPSLSSKSVIALPQVRYLSSKSDSDDKDDKKPKQVQSVATRLKKMWKAYGVLAVGTYLGVYASTLGSLFLALDYDVFNAATVGLDPAYAIHMFCDVIEKFTGNTHVPDYIRENPRVGTFAIAWVMTKFTEPLRLGFTVATVPTIARWLGHRREKHDDDDDDDDDDNDDKKHNKKKFSKKD